MRCKLRRNHNRGQGNEIFLHFILCAIEPLPAALFIRKVHRTSWAGLAQLVEHLICNQGVTSSNLVAGTILMNPLQSEGKSSKSSGGSNHHHQRIKRYTATTTEDKRIHVD